MVRTQIQLTEKQHRDLKRWAGERGISLSEAVRRCIVFRLASDQERGDRAARVREALAVVGKYADRTDRSRVAIDHDEALTEAYRR